MKGDMDVQLKEIGCTESNKNQMRTKQKSVMNQYIENW